MKISKCFLITILTITFAGFIALAENGAAQTASATNQKVRVQIQIVADSSNFLQATLEVPPGASARDLMDRLFKMSYADLMHRFVNGIAGFSAPAREKKFWKLEIDGKDSEVGIAEIKINKPMQIRWVLAEIK
jgi:hypothetical protein